MLVAVSYWKHASRRSLEQPYTKANIGKLKVSIGEDEYEVADLLAYQQFSLWTSGLLKKVIWASWFKRRIVAG
jgi:hypothetical protein